jgi:hypothetical protein
MSFLSVNELSAAPKTFAVETALPPGKHRVRVKAVKVKPSMSGLTTQLCLRVVTEANEGAWANFGLSGGNAEYRTRENARLKSLLLAVGLEAIEKPEDLKGRWAEVLIIHDSDPVFIIPSASPEPEPKPEPKPKGKRKPKA